MMKGNLNGNFFRKMSCKGNPCQNIGENTLRSYGLHIATFLNLQCPERFTGHTYRRTGATILAEVKDITFMQLKKAGGWNSDKIVEEYVEDSKLSKSTIASAISSDACVLGTTPSAAVDMSGTDNIATVAENVKRQRTEDCGASAGHHVYNFSGASNCSVSIVLSPGEKIVV